MMNRSRLILTVLVAALWAGGCRTQRYRVQPLGQTPYAEAFQSGKTVFAQYFRVSSADPRTGKIVGRPKAVEAARDRLLGASSARQVATMRIRKKGGQVYADVRVEIQRQDTGAFSTMQPVTVHNELPSNIPTQEEAALTAEQDQAWQITGREHALERAILGDLLQRLTPAK